MFDNRKLSGQNTEYLNKFLFIRQKCLDKRTREETDNDGCNGAKTKNSYETDSGKWISENDKTLHTVKWLGYEMAGSDREHNREH